MCCNNSAVITLVGREDKQLCTDTEERMTDKDTLNLPSDLDSPTDADVEIDDCYVDLESPSTSDVPLDDCCADLGTQSDTKILPSTSSDVPLDDCCVDMEIQFDTGANVATTVSY